MDIKIVDGDLLEQDVEVIVNAWNRNTIPWRLGLPQGVSGAIKRRGGYAPFPELARRGPIPLGGAGTGGGGEERVLTIMRDELRRLELGGEVRIVRYRKGEPRR